MKIRIKTIIDVIVAISFSIIIYLKRSLYWIVFGLLFIAFLLNISATTITFIKQKDHKVALQKRDVTIYSLLVACEQDYLIKRIRGKKK